MTREANTAQNVYFKEAKPVGIGDLQESLGLKDTEVVHQNVRFRHLLQEGRNTLGRAEITGNPADLGILNMLPDALEGRRHSCFGAAIDDDLGAFCGKRGSDGETNARGRA